MTISSLSPLASDNFWYSSNYSTGSYFEKENTNTLLLKETLCQLDKLYSWPKNWDGCGAKKPKEEALFQTKQFLENLFDLTVDLNSDWTKPNITAGSQGEVVLEWWSNINNSKEITLYITGKTIEYIKSFNEKIQDMEDGKLKKLNMASYQKLFDWLNE